jgi:DNA ligase (NAD+)
LLEIEGFGKEMAESFLEFLRVNEELIDRLKEILDISVTKQQATQDSKFYQKRVVITGTLSKPRDEFKKLLELKGALVSNSISKKTDFLLCGKNAGSKLQKAKDLGVEIVDEEQFWSMIEA